MFREEEMNKVTNRPVQLGQLKQELMMQIAHQISLQHPDQ